VEGLTAAKLCRNQKRTAPVQRLPRVRTSVSEEERRMTWMCRRTTSKRALPSGHRGLKWTLVSPLRRRPGFDNLRIVTTPSRGVFVVEARRAAVAWAFAAARENASRSRVRDKTLLFPHWMEALMLLVYSR